MSGQRVFLGGLLAGATGAVIGVALGWSLAGGMAPALTGLLGALATSSLGWLAIRHRFDGT